MRTGEIQTFGRKSGPRLRSPSVWSISEKLTTLAINPSKGIR